MHHIVWLLGAWVAVWGITAVLRPDWMKRIIDFFAVGRRFWIAAALKVVAGILFLVFARDCRIPWVIIVIGILTAGGSLVTLVLQPEKVHAMMAWWQKRPIWVYRLWGVAAVLFGSLIIYAGIPGSR